MTYDFDYKHPWHRALAREISRTMRKPASNHMRRSEQEWRQFAGMTMDFILDVSDSRSFWQGYESWNSRYFGVPLPITEGAPGVGLTDVRLRHFVWKMLAIIAPDFSLPPKHPDVLTLVDTVGSFWEKRKGKFVPISDSSAFCAGPNDSGWEVKGKFVAFGETSYFFRALYGEYIAPYMGTEAEFEAVDDFLCQSCSPWSGMGPIDLLAEVLELPEARREDIRGWSQRHAAPYLIDSMEPDELLVTNLATDVQYRVERDFVALPFHAGAVLFGSLVPWNGRWRWSGVQRMLGEGKTGIAGAKEFVGKMRQSTGPVLCRYWPEYGKQVQEIAGDLHRAELKFHGGSDLVYFDTVESLAASKNQFFADYRQERLGKLQASMKEAGKAMAPPQQMIDMGFPDEVLGLAGVALFLNPEEGAEMMFDYDNLLPALEKNGGELTEVERDTLRGFIQSTAISPAFVRRVLRETKDGSLKTEFGVEGNAPSYWLGWLLRCWKGEYYRPRYPAVSVV